MKNAFEKPFRKEEPRNIPPRVSQNRVVDEPLISNAGGPSNTSSAPERASGLPPGRGFSPEWDIEHEDFPAIGTGGNQVFDIELDL